MQPYETGRQDGRAGMTSRPSDTYTLAQVREYEQGFHDGFWEAD
jgi:hypothetical protein